MVEGDPSAIFYTARSLLRLEPLFGGRIPRIRGKGHGARAVADMLAHPARARALGEAARADARARYDHRVCAETCLSILGLASAPPASPRPPCFRP